MPYDEEMRVVRFRDESTSLIDDIVEAMIIMRCVDSMKWRLIRQLGSERDVCCRARRRILSRHHHLSLHLDINYA